MRASGSARPNSSLARRPGSAERYIVRLCSARPGGRTAAARQAGIPFRIAGGRTAHARRASTHAAHPLKSPYLDRRIRRPHLRRSHTSTTAVHVRLPTPAHPSTTSSPVAGVYNGSACPLTDTGASACHIFAGRTRLQRQRMSAYRHRRIRRPHLRRSHTSTTAAHVRLPTPAHPPATSSPVAGVYNGSACVDRISLSTMNERTCRTPGRYSSCSACSRLKLSLSRVRTSMK